MARLSRQYSNNFNIQYNYYISLPYFSFSFCIFLFGSIFFISLPINLYIRVLTHVFFILFSLFYMRSIFFIFITYFIFWFRVGIFIFFLISMQHVIT